MARFTEWSPELEAALAEPFPAEWVKQKKAGKGERAASISFVSWNRYAERLNDLVGGGWSMGTPVTLHVGDKLVMGLPVTVLGATRINFGDEDDSEWETVTDQQTGEETEKKTMYGSPATNAFAQAFKRTCALFGIGLYLYNKGAPVSAGNRSTAAPAGFSVDQKIGKGAHKDLTWAQLAQEPKGPEYIGWALSKWTHLPPEAKSILGDLVNGPKGGATEAVLLQDKLNQAIGVDAVSFEQAERIEGVIHDGGAEKMKQAMAWLEQQMEKRKLGAEV
jgi:hypothetical protein